MTTTTLHLIDSLGAGGAEQSLVELLPALRSHDIDPYVVVKHRRDVGVEDQMLASGVEVIAATGRLPEQVRQVRRLIDELGADLVHSSLFHANQLGRAATLHGPPLLTSLVNTPFAAGRYAAGGAAGWKLAVLQGYERLTASRLTTHFHALTDAVAEHAVSAMGVPDHKITVVPRGRDPRRLGSPSPERRRRTRAALGLDADEPVLVNVGRQEPQKGQRVLLDALAMLRDQGRRPTTLVAGREGNSSSSLRALARQLELTDQVRFLGHREDVTDIVACADLFVFPSLYEGQGGAVIEAMALEVPIVAAACPAVVEVLADGAAGRLVPPGDAAALADAIGAILDGADDPADRVAAARSRFDAHYTHEAVVDAMAALFTRVAAAG